MRRQLLILAGFAAAIGLTYGCAPRHFETEADRLRAEVLDLQTQVQQLERRETELQAELRRARRWQDRREELADPDIGEFVPHVVSISLGRLSHVRDTSGDGWPDTLLLYVSPVDGRGRFTQLVGQLLVNAVILPPDDDAISVVRTRLGPAQVRDAYRSGITGTHYSVEVPLNLPEGVDLAWVEAQQIIVRVSYIDGQTGEQHTAERAVSLRR